jgi:hypothetical protein
MEGDVHNIGSRFDDTLEFVAHRPFKRNRREAAQGDDQVRDPVDVRAAAALVDGQYVHASTVRR